MPLTLVQQVDKEISAVRQAHSDAIGKLLSGWIVTDFDKSAANGLKSFTGSIDHWADVGREAAKADKLPTYGSWPKWIETGNFFKERIAAALGSESYTALDAIVETVKEAPANVPTDLANAAKATGRVAKSVAVEVAGAAGETTAAALKPLWPLLAGVGVLAVVAVVGAVKVKP